MTPKRLGALALSPQNGACSAVQPLPADEQLALLFHLADNWSAPDIANEAQSSKPLPLAEAYLSCAHITRQHSKSFYFSSQFLPLAKRHAIRALYAFCRASDDIVDTTNPDAPEADAAAGQESTACALADWVHRVRCPIPQQDNAVLLAWYDTRTRYNLAAALVDELLAGIAMDLTINRYQTFADLWLYCYRVASVVGLLSMGIIGSARGAEPYAIKLGVALQLTNILRDVGEDAGRGRVYLPEADLRRFGLSADDILRGVHDDRFRALMRFELARAYQLYTESWPGIALLPVDSRFAVGVAARTYRGILDKIVLNDYDVYHQRAHLTRSEKIHLLPAIWRDVRQMSRTASAAGKPRNRQTTSHRQNKESS